MKKEFFRDLAFVGIVTVLFGCTTSAPPNAHRVESSPYHHEIQELARQQCASRGGFLIREPERWRCIAPEGVR